jgi:RNA polymerase sigma-70 factor, ECF subfamily
MQLSGETLARAIKGDETAFAEIVQQNKSMVFSLAYHFLFDKSLAEELAQEVFLQLFQNLKRMESPEHLVFWLRRVTGHRCIDWNRKHSLQSHVNLEDLPDPQAPERPGDPLLACRLQQLVASLPEKPRMIVTLRYQEDLQLSEIAEILEIPLNTVKSLLQRALTKLHEKLVAAERIKV